MHRFHALAAIVLSLSALVVTSGSSAALSCARHPSADPETILSGEAELAGEGTFWERYDLVVVGTVVSVDTDETDGSVTYGRTAIALDTLAVFGSSDAPDTFVVGASDPGWLSGNFYDVGQTYFIPIVLEGSDGIANYSFVCDPVSVVHPNAAQDLIEVAQVRDIESATPGEPLEPPPDTSNNTDPDGDAPDLAVAADAPVVAEIPIETEDGGIDAIVGVVYLLVAASAVVAVVAWRRAGTWRAESRPQGRDS